MALSVRLQKLTRPDRTALIVIDMQNDFCSDGGALSKGGVNIAPIQEMLSRLEGLIELARNYNVHVIFVRTENSERTDPEAWFGRSGQYKRFIPRGLSGFKILDLCSPRQEVTPSWNL